MVPREFFAGYGDFAAFFTGPSDELTVYEESGGSGDADAFTYPHVETDFLRDLVGGDVLMELIEVAFAIGNFGEVFVKESSAIRAGGVFPFSLILKELVSIGLPVALEAGGFGGGGGSSAVLVVAEEIISVDDSKLAISGLDGVINTIVHRGAAGALEVGIFENKDGGVFIAFDIVADVAVMGIWGDDGIEIIVIVIGSFVIGIDDEDGRNDDKRKCSDGGNDACFHKAV